MSGKGRVIVSFTIYMYGTFNNLKIREKENTSFLKQEKSHTYHTVRLLLLLLMMMMMIFQTHGPQQHISSQVFVALNYSCLG